MLQRAILYIKEIQDIGLFAAMSNARVYLAFAASPLFYIMLPFIAILLTALAIINGYHLVRAKERDFEKWFTFISSTLTAIAASASLYGAVIASLMGTTFVFGPWLFLCAISVGVIYQSVMLGRNIYAWQTATDKALRESHIQSIFANVFSLLTLAAIVGTVTFVMLTPIAPLVGSAFALTSAVFIAASIIWRLIPSNWKDTLKVNLHLVDELPAETVESSQGAALALEKDPAVYVPFLTQPIPDKTSDDELSSQSSFVSNCSPG